MPSISLKIVRICKSIFKCNYLENENVFLSFLLHVWNLHQILNILKKRMIVIANVFPKLETVDSQHVKASQILAKSPWEHFRHDFSSFWGNLIWEMCSLVLGEVLVVFVNRLTADGKHPVQDRDNLQVPIQMILWKKRKTFSQFFLTFLESTSNFKLFEKRIIVTANVFPKLETVKILVRPLLKKRHFRTPFDSRHVKASQILVKSPWVHFSHVFHHSEGS